jgi:hypothetical protein
MSWRSRCARHLCMHSSRAACIAQQVGLPGLCTRDAILNIVHSAEILAMQTVQPMHPYGGSAPLHSSALPEPREGPHRGKRAQWCEKSSGKAMRMKVWRRIANSSCCRRSRSRAFANADCPTIAVWLVGRIQMKNCGPSTTGCPDTPTSRTPANPASRPSFRALSSYRYIAPSAIG